MDVIEALLFALVWWIGSLLLFWLVPKVMAFKIEKKKYRFGRIVIDVV